MDVVVCLGECCHEKGAHYVAGKLRELIRKSGHNDEIDMRGFFCLNKCKQAVCVRVDGEYFSVSPKTVDEFFEKNIKAKF